MNLRGYGQKDPLTEYKVEAYRCFEQMMEQIRQDDCFGLFRAAERPESIDALVAKVAQARFQKDAPETSTTAGSQQEQPDIELPKPVKRELPKVGRNDLCPCGSGKKFKRCCGRYQGN